MRVFIRRVFEKVAEVVMEDVQVFGISESHGQGLSEKRLDCVLLIEVRKLAQDLVNQGLLQSSFFDSATRQKFFHELLLLCSFFVEREQLKASEKFLGTD